MDKIRNALPYGMLFIHGWQRKKARILDDWDD